MATGKIHAQTTQSNIKYIVVSATGLGIYLHNPAVFGMIAGAVIAHWLTPDYDLNTIQYTQRMLIRKCWIMGWAWRVYWYPYSILCAHRGRSHTWPLGTLIRLAYLLLPLAILVYCYSINLAGLASWVGFIFVGQSLQDWSHLRLDHIMPYAVFAQKRNRRGKVKLGV